MTWGLGQNTRRCLACFWSCKSTDRIGAASAGCQLKRVIGLAMVFTAQCRPVFQIPFGLLFDRIGRKPLIVGGGLLKPQCSAASRRATDTTIRWGIILAVPLWAPAPFAVRDLPLQRSDLSVKIVRGDGLYRRRHGVSAIAIGAKGMIDPHHLSWRSLYVLSADDFAAPATVSILLPGELVPHSR